MNTHTHSEYATEKDLLGHYNRLKDVEVKQEGIFVKTERNEEDINKLFTLANRNAKTAASLEKSLAGLIGKISGAAAVVVILVELAWKLIGKLLS